MQETVVAEGDRDTERQRQRHRVTKGDRDTERHRGRQSMQEWWSRRWHRSLRWLLRDGGFEGCATEASKVAMAAARWRGSERADGGWTEVRGALELDEIETAL
ncbi:hypothetical protein AAHE18_17G191800 [Arachis hypogaea]